MSVWTGIEALFEFSYRTAHAEVLRARKQWFSNMEAASLALWWLPAGEIPTVGDGVARLEHLRQTARARRRSHSNNALSHPTSNRWPRISAT